MMRRIMFLVLATLFSVPSFAIAGAAGRVELYSDAALSQCTLADTGPQIAEIYVFHRLGWATILDGAAGIMFRLGASPGFTGVWLEDVLSPGLLANGNTQSWIAVGYGCWHDTDTLVLHARYQMSGTSTQCSYVEALPRPGFAWIVGNTCGYGDELPVDGDRIQVNPDESCPCEVPPVATESTTWGRVKAMYRN